MFFMIRHEEHFKLKRAQIHDLLLPTLIYQNALLLLIQSSRFCYIYLVSVGEENGAKRIEYKDAV